MKRAEIEEQVCTIISTPMSFVDAVVKLTDLFIQLSNSRCEEQKEYCIKELEGANQCITTFDEQVHNILNAPLPEII